GASLPVAKFGDSDKLTVGQTVLAMGSPAGLSQCVTVGVVSNTQMIMPYGTFNMDGESVGTVVRWVGHDATIFHGNSGGPLVDLDGNIVGINEMGVGGIGGAIPGNLAQSIAQQIIANKGKVQRSWTGLECQAMLKSATGTRGVLVGGVIADSPAAKAGMEPGDIIVETNGVKVLANVGEELPLFNQMVLSHPIGKTIRFDVMRNGKPMKFEFATVARDAAVGEDYELKPWGMTAMDFTTLSAMEKQRAKEGAIVQTIREGGPCNVAKPALVRGDVITEVNGKKINTVADLKAITAEITKDNDGKVETVVAFDRGTRKLLSVVRIGKDADKNDPPSAKKAWIGVSTQVLTSELAKALKLEGKSGVRVTQVLAGTEAQKADLKVGDIIVKFDGEAVKAFKEGDEAVFTYMVSQRPIDKKVPLEIIRDSTEMTLDITLQSPPPKASELKSYRDVDFEFTAREMSFFDRSDKKLNKDIQGVLIDRVEEAGWAALGGLGSGDILLTIDGKAVTDVTTLQTILKEAKARKATRLVFQVKRGIH
ncbi:MAG: PDZ domain-containing protein, partial [Planctomycetaceae bacterium]